MSAMTGIWECRTISARASASSWLGQATRTIWQPDAVSSAICWRVALTSAVSVVVIDCTLIGAPPPTFTPPTSICRVGRRSATVGGGSCGSPRSTVVISGCPSCSLDLDRVEDAGVEQHQRQPDEQDEDSVGERHHLEQVDASGVVRGEAAVERAAALLVAEDGDVAAVE